MHFLRFLAGPLAAGLLMLVPASMPVFAQTSTDVPAPATGDSG